MNRKAKSVKLSAILLTSALILSACSSGSGGGAEGSSDFDLTQIQSKLTAVAPKCVLEKVELAKEGKVNGFPVESIIVDDLIGYLTDFSGVLPNPDAKLATYNATGWNTSPDENVLTWKLNAVNEIYICNTNGVPVSNLKSNVDANFDEAQRYSGVNGDKCRFYKPYTAQNSADAKKCLTTLKSLKRDGEWVVITTTDGASPKELVTLFMSGLKKVYDDNPQDSRGPLAVGDSYVLNFHVGYNLLNDAQNAERNKLWVSIVKALGVTTWEKLDTDGAGFVGDYSTQFSTEEELDRVIRREADVVECSEPLKITENTATNSDCGKIKLDVFQSDLNSGECTFLAYWNDKSGNSRIGIFRYCGAFTPGSVEEDSYYTLRVQVTGPESYTTAGGSTSRVLGFTVLGE
ncbi:MAG: hypothetical protein RLZ46_802 [Actinomycetota bacterium]|jgi:CxxC motif-containing protein